MDKEISQIELDELSRMSLKGFIWSISLLDRDHRLTPLEEIMFSRLKEVIDKNEVSMST